MKFMRETNCERCKKLLKPEQQNLWVTAKAVKILCDKCVLKLPNLVDLK